MKIHGKIRTISLGISWAVDWGYLDGPPKKIHADSGLVQTARVGRAKTAALKACHNISSSYEELIGLYWRLFV